MFCLLFVMAFSVVDLLLCFEGNVFCFDYFVFIYLFVYVLQK
jgi:hypothetical protein